MVCPPIPPLSQSSDQEAGREETTTSQSKSNVQKNEAMQGHSVH